MRLLILTFFTFFCLFTAAQAKEKQPEVDLENLLYMDLKDGRVEIKLYPAFAPKTVERIKLLTRQGFYDGLTFHRVREGFMAQTGDPKGDGTGGSDLPNLPDEFNIKRHWRRAVSMANMGPNSSNSQFFILFDDAPSLDGHYTVFGKVITGMNYVDNIKKGDPQADGYILDGKPDKIIRMRVAADVVGTEDEHWRP